MDAYWPRVQDKARDSQPESSDVQERQKSHTRNLLDLVMQPGQWKGRLEISGACRIKDDHWDIRVNLSFHSPQLDNVDSGDSHHI